MFADSTSSPIDCPACGRPALAVTLMGRTFTECDPCAKSEQARREAESRQIRAVEAWKARTPSEMQRALNWGLVAPEIAKAQNADVLQGVALIGSTDSGKTRVGYWILKKLAVNHGMTGQAVTHAEFRKAASSVNNNDHHRADAAHTLIQLCRNVPALLIDDVGKGATTETADEAFFDLLTFRRDNSRLTLWTANAGSKWLAQRFGPDRGPAIITRLAALVRRDQIFTTEQR